MIAYPIEHAWNQSRIFIITVFDRVVRKLYFFVICNDGIPVPLFISSSMSKIYVCWLDLIAFGHRRHKHKFDIT